MNVYEGILEGMRWLPLISVAGISLYSYFSKPPKEKTSEQKNLEKIINKNKF